MELQTFDMILVQAIRVMEHFTGSSFECTLQGPTSHWKKRGVIRAFNSAPQSEYGNNFRNQPGTFGKPYISSKPHQFNSTFN